MSNTPLRTQSIIQVQERALELGWFHDLEVSFSYWHGGKLLLDGPKFQWPAHAAWRPGRGDSSAQRSDRASPPPRLMYPR